MADRGQGKEEISTKNIYRTLLPINIAVLENTMSNVTGDSEVVTVIFDAEDVDIGGNYNVTTGELTFPYTGLYYVNTRIVLDDLDIGHNTGVLELSFTGSATYSKRLWTASPLGCANAAGEATMIGSALIDANANDVMTVKLYVQGGTTTVDIFGSSTDYRTTLEVIMLNLRV